MFARVATITGDNEGKDVINISWYYRYELKLVVEQKNQCQNKNKNVPFLLTNVVGICFALTTERLPLEGIKT